AVIALLRTVEERGLRPADYDAAPLGEEEAALGGANPPAGDAPRIARFDVSVSRAVMRLLAHLHAGRVDPRALRFDLPETHRDADLAALTIAVSRAADPAAAIAAAEPRYAGYAALLRGLARYRALAADSSVRAPLLPAAGVRPGDALGAAPALRRFLAALGDYRPPGDSGISADSMRYTPELVAAVEGFQRRHSLEPDGVIGRATVRQLRFPLLQRVQQLELTLERWRWLPDVPPERYAVVNIPGFRLIVFEHDSTAAHPLLQMSVIVGQAAGRHGTPVFTGTMEEVVFRPFWDVPPSIARKELVPRILREPAYFDSERFEIVRGGADDARSYPPTGENLDLVAAGTLRLRQRPGAINALGLVKFVFPNSHNVYLHGTPAQELFARTRRDFSHGCIRIENPVALAELVLRDQAEWGPAAIDAAMHGDRTVRVRIAEPVAVFIVYATAVARGDGSVSFYPDLYRHDAALARALEPAGR
ncbi:MAG TPA: L,D-transpeptidase family protein, partial [Gemmatimonadaceae bacterium]|nr:L,D-transpeptidase family protein [Gemmatimonadaceae bacterium]